MFLHPRCHNSECYPGVERDKGSDCPCLIHGLRQLISGKLGFDHEGSGRDAYLTSAFPRIQRSSKQASATPHPCPLGRRVPKAVCPSWSRLVLVRSITAYEISVESRKFRVGWERNRCGGSGHSVSAPTCRLALQSSRALWIMSREPVAAGMQQIDAATSGYQVAAPTSVGSSPDSSSSSSAPTYFRVVMM